MRDPKITMDTVRACNAMTRGGWPNGQALINALADVAKLEALERQGRRLGERQCNGVPRWDSKAGRVLASWTEADETALEAAWDKIKARAREIVKPYGVEVTFQRDPRGPAIRLVVDGGEWPL